MGLRVIDLGIGNVEEVWGVGIDCSELVRSAGIGEREVRRMCRYEVGDDFGSCPWISDGPRLLEEKIRSKVIQDRQQRGGVYLYAPLGSVPQVLRLR